LATQLLLTVVLVLLVIRFSFHNFSPAAPTSFGVGLVRSIWWMQWVLLVLSLLSICLLFATKHTYPINYFSLLLFTLIMASSVAFTCVLYYAAGLGQQIVLAAAITTATFLLLTLYTMCSKTDFSFMGPFLFASINLLLIWGGVLGFAFFCFGYSPGWDIAYSVLGTIIFCGYIVYDTHRIMHVLGVDDYVLGAIELYLDLINLFMYILRILSASSSRD
jgi:FtsH-binding integral membrane protein